MSNTALIPVTLDLSCKGEIITSNLAEFRAAVTAGLANINLSLTTPEEFGMAESSVKALKSAQEAVKQAKERALDDAAAIRDLFDQLDDVNEEIRQARLTLERQIKSEKDRIKSEILMEGVAIIALSSGLSEVKATLHFHDDLAEAIKGKRTLDSMRDAVTHSANRIAAEISMIDKIIGRYQKERGAIFVPDRDQLLASRPDEVEAALAHRAEQADKRAAEEAHEARRKAEAEEAARKRAEAEARLAAEKATLTEEPKDDVEIPDFIEGLGDDTAFAAFKEQAQDALGSLTATANTLTGHNRLQAHRLCARFSDAIDSIYGHHTTNTPT